MPQIPTLRCAYVGLLKQKRPEGRFSLEFSWCYGFGVEVVTGRTRRTQAPLTRWCLLL